jgi:hypothetical protein
MSIEMIEIKGLNELLFPTPDTPDLGCHVRNEHGFEHDYDFHIWSELSQVILGPHQVYFRVRCGKAAFYQRTNVYMSSVFVPPGTPADAVLGGDFRPRPSDWRKFPPQQAPLEYYFHGEYRNPATPAWHWDAAVGHSFDIYDNGTRSIVGWDDTGGDMDLNDHLVEVAVVNRTDYFGVFTPAEVKEAELENFQSEILPEYRNAHRAHETTHAV